MAMAGKWLLVLKGGVERTVMQFHYVSWPDFGVPGNAANLLQFRRRVLKANPANAGMASLSSSPMANLNADVSVG